MACKETDPRWAGAIRVAPLALAVALVAACSEGAATDAGPRMPGSVGSLDELGSQVVAAFVASDTARLDSLRLTTEEYATRVYPAIQAARPDEVLPLAISVRGFVMRNGRAMGRYLARVRGLPLRAEGTECRGGKGEYEGMTILRDCVIRVADDRGRREEITLFRQVVVVNGGYKALRYDD